MCIAVFRHNAIAYLIGYSINITFIGTGQSKKCDSLYCADLEPNCNICEIRLYMKVFLPTAETNFTKGREFYMGNIFTF